MVSRETPVHPAPPFVLCPHSLALGRFGAEHVVLQLHQEALIAEEGSLAVSSRPASSAGVVQQGECCDCTSPGRRLWLPLFSGVQAGKVVEGSLPPNTEPLVGWGPFWNPPVLAGCSAELAGVAEALADEGQGLVWRSQSRFKSRPCSASGPSPGREGGHQGTASTGHQGLS